MMRQLSRKTIVIIATLMVAILSYLYFVQEKIVSDPATLPPMRTHCVGRYLIDLPEDFALTIGSELQLYYGLGKDFERVQIELSRLNGEKPTFQQLVRQRVGELQAMPNAKSQSRNMLAELKAIDETMTLVSAYKSPSLLESFRLHLFAQRGEAVVRYENFKYHVSEKPIEYFERQLLKVAQETTYTPASTGAQGGTCMGTTTINAGQNGEVFTLAFRSKAHSDVLITIDMNSLPEKGDGGLLKRVDGKADMLTKLGVSSTTLRRGKTTISGRPAEELLDQGKDNDKIVRLFSAETLITEPSTLVKPVLAVSMSMGGQIDGGPYVDASLSRDEALAWWDAIISSIRMR
ncbi:T6SS immunity protein Tli4 family protein [Dechloromonas denitrificans]|uniref:T6SS immunity protein Tli4 family protein n=1 Tax=Dechloromonas denitrificans TaxID=281362 RepID=UPI001CF81E65|nr:T6SS immunity protein Tli4 family protein [Dechloromonas denitrificans]UCV02622.1 hypothetical protein KI611_16260 [Dechloromonas denitrificans]